jgi:pimeloyl-ACP methyl ester carboxylesterase
VTSHDFDGATHMHNNPVFDSSRCDKPLRSASRVAIALVLAVAAAQSARADSQDVTLQKQMRTVTLSDGKSVRVEAGELQVPESRARPSKRRVTIPYYRLRSTARQPAAPIFMLAGGPGEPALDLFETDPGDSKLALFLQGIADVVILDQRGAGRAQPRLDCTQRIEWPLDQPLSREAHAAQLRHQATLCRDEWISRGVDLAAYNTLENAADVDALRTALGYQRISLMAHSYGTHLALALLRNHSQSIERAVLHGLEGPDHTYDLPSLTLETLGRIAAAAERTPSLAPAIPKGGLIAALTRAEDRLASAPLTVTVEREGKPVTITLSRHDLQRISRMGSRDRSEMSWPAHVIRMDRGDFSLAAQEVLDARAWPIDPAMYFMMDCASGLSPARRARLDRDPADLRAQDILGDINLPYSATCEVWNAPDLGEGFRADVKSDVPVLFVQGTWDMSTAFVNAEEVARGFSKGTLVSVEGGTHSVLWELFDSSPGARQLIGEFMRTGAVTGPRQITLPDANFVLPEQLSPR